MEGLVKVGFIDKATGRYYAENRKVEFADARIKELADLGYVELKNAPKAKPEVKAEAVEEPKRVAKKATAEVKPVAKPKKPTTKKK